MERELFDWGSWDGEIDCMTFYNPVLKAQIGEFEPGTKFDYATILQIPETSKGVLELGMLGPEEEYLGTKIRKTVICHQFSLSYKVGNKL